MLRAVVLQQLDPLVLLHGACGRRRACRRWSAVDHDDLEVVVVLGPDGVQARPEEPLLVAGRDHDRDALVVPMCPPWLAGSCWGRNGTSGAAI